MADNKTRGQQLFDQEKKVQPASGGGESFQVKMVRAVAKIRNLFLQPRDANVPKTVAETKATSNLFSGTFGAFKISLKTINKVLAFILVALIALTVYVVFGNRPSINSVTAAVSRINYQDLEDQKITAFGKLSDYLNQLKTRDIFNEYEEPKPPPPVEQPKEIEPPPPPKVTIQEKAKNLKLMGISWGDDPKVIIRNEATQEIHFLQEGERVKGTDITIKQIMKDEVILSSDDEEMKML